MNKIINISTNKYLNKAFLVVFLLLSTLASSYIIAQKGIEAGVAITLLFIGIPFAVASFINIRFGFLFALFYSFFLFLIKKLTQDAIPAGVFADALILITFAGIFHQKEFRKGDLSTYFKNPFIICFIIWLSFWLIQIANPAAVSLEGWLFSIRGTVVTIFILVIAFYFFDNLRVVKTFTKFWLALALLVAAYGIFQEFHGYLPFEEEWLRRNPDQLKLVFNWGRFRRWSFLSDVSTFGMFMSYAGMFCLIMALGPYKPKYKILLGISGILMLISMSFSGTRTATAMVPAGMVLFLLMTLNNLRTVLIAAFISLTFIGLMVGPFYSGPIRRMRSTFEPEKDMSMRVREVNRERIRPYVWTHPIGGGISTTGSEGSQMAKGHPLAGFPPDSGYLKIALERGWIGLLITMALHFSVLYLLVKHYYASRNPVIKNLLAAYTVGLFMLVVANYAQDVQQKPLDIIMYASFILAMKLPKFEEPL